MIVRSSQTDMRERGGEGEEEGEGEGELEGEGERRFKMGLGSNLSGCESQLRALPK